jgi:hypothetical protein
VEIDALRSVFGPELLAQMRVGGTKGGTGHAMGVAFEEVIAVEMLRTRTLPLVRNFAQHDPILQVRASPPPPTPPAKVDAAASPAHSTVSSSSTSHHVLASCPLHQPTEGDETGPNLRLTDGSAMPELNFVLRFSAGFGSQISFALYGKN